MSPYGETELMVQGGDDRRSAAAPDVEMRLAPAPVGNGEDVVGDRQPERHHGQRPADDQCGYLVGGMIDGQVQPGGAEGGEDGRGRPLPPVPPPPGGHQRVENPHQRQGERGDGPRWLRVALPGPEDTDADGPHPADLQRHGRDQQRRGEDDDQVGREMPETAERDKHRDGPPRDQPRRPRRRQGGVDVEHQMGEPGGAHRGHHAEDREVGPGNDAEDRGDRHARPQGTGHPGEQQVPADAVVDMAGQRRRLP